MSITWGSVTFDGPYPVADWEPPCRAGLYAVMIRPDPINKPDTFTIVYFGESGNLSERGFFKAHHKFACWNTVAGAEKNLYIGIHLKPYSSADERRQIEAALVKQYMPSCNS